MGINSHCSHSQILHMTDFTAIHTYRVLWKHLDAVNYVNNISIYFTSTETHMTFQHTTAASRTLSETILTKLRNLSFMLLFV